MPKTRKESSYVFEKGTGNKRLMTCQKVVTSRQKFINYIYLLNYLIRSCAVSYKMANLGLQLLYTQWKFEKYK